MINIFYTIKFVSFTVATSLKFLVFLLKILVIFSPFTQKVRLTPIAIKYYRKNLQKIFNYFSNYCYIVAFCTSPLGFDRDREDRRDNPKKGNTIYVHGHGVTEELLRKAFATFGTIVNITMELDRK